jgi:uridine kinase
MVYYCELHYIYLDDIRLCRRILRDVKERGRTEEGVLYQYNKFVKRAFDDYIRPTMSYSDIIVPGSRNNYVAITLIVNHLKNMSKQLVFFKEITNKLHFFGDILYTLNNVIYPLKPSIESVIEVLEKTHNPFRKLLFPLDNDSKENFLFYIKYLTH